MKSRIIRYSIYALCYVVGGVITANTIIPGMKKGLKYDDTTAKEAEDCPVEEVEPSAN